MASEQYRSVLSRRLLLKSVGAGSAMLCGGLSPLVDAASAESQVADGRQVRLTEFVYLGGNQPQVPRELIAQYEAQHPNVHVDVLEGNNARDFPKILAQHRIDAKNPLVHFGHFTPDSIAKGMLEDMWLKLDPAKVPNMRLAVDSLRFPHDCSVGFGLWAVGFVYNKKFVKEPPVSWDDLFAPRFKGRVILFDYAWLINGFMGVAYAHSKKQPAIDAAFEKYAKAARDGQFLAMYTSNQQAKEILARGDAWMAPQFLNLAVTWNNDEVQRGGEAPFGYTIPKEGVVAAPNDLAIMKACTPDQREVAEYLTNQNLDPEVVGRYCTLTSTIPGIKGAKVGGKLAEEPLFQPTVAENAIVQDYDLVTAKDSDWRQRWDREVKSVMK